jgi:GTPase
MEKEKEDGNVEYKLKILCKDNKRKEELISQMAYRLNEGGGECTYILGISDHGEPLGITRDDYKVSLDNIEYFAQQNDALIINISEKTLEHNDKKNCIYEILIREQLENKHIDIKVAVAGNVDSGKSSLIGVLVNGKNDNGRGAARTSVFNFPHEMKSGRTSSIAHHILGYDNKGDIVNYDASHKQDWREIVKKSSKIISFFDLAGHEKYLKTTILGLSSSIPDLCIITIGANMGITRMTKEHIFLCVMLNIPMAIIITKIDICKNREEVMINTIQDLKKILKLPGIRRMTYKINDKEDILLASKNKNNNSMVPLFFVSNVSGEGIDLIKKYLNFINKHKNNRNNYNKNVEYHIDTIFFVAGVGTVVGGHLKYGTIKVGDKLYLGPYTENNSYEPFIVKSIHVKRTLVEEVRSSCYACICLKKVLRKNIRKGQVLLGELTPKNSVREFDADISILKSHSTTIKKGYQPVLHCSTVRQAAKIIEINKKISSKKNETNDSILRTGDKANVRFRFSYRKEFITVGNKILLAEGKIKILGVITKIY